VFTLDDRIRGIPAAREQVIALYQSINAPNLAIPGKKAGPAQAYVVGLRGTGGFAVFIYLYMQEAQDCAVYASEKRQLTPETYGPEEQEAIAFCESMAFLMDNTNFRSLPVEQQEEMMKTLPVFQRDPRSVKPAGSEKAASAQPARKDSVGAIGRLLTSF
jgi:hypothetical protein